MSLLEEIQNAAIDSNEELGAILRRCKVLAARLGNKPLEDWLLWESNGYPIEAELPDYRIWNLTLKGHFSGPFGSGLRNAPIPAICIPAKYRGAFSDYGCRMSVSALEQLLAGNKSGTFEIDVGDLNVVLGTGVYQGTNCVQAWAEIGMGALVEVVNSVRNRILDFVLAIEKEYPSAGDRAVSAASFDEGRVTQIFNTTVYGGSMNLVGSVAHSVLTQEIRPHSFESLKSQLEKLGLPHEDVKSLKDAIDADPTPSEANKLGPKVAAWLGDAIQKAASGTWAITVNVASSVLTEMLLRFYGLNE